MGIENEKHTMEGLVGHLKKDFALIMQNQKCNIQEITNQLNRVKKQTPMHERT